MTARDLIRYTAERFRSAGIPDPENDAALLLSHLTGKPALNLRLDMDSDLEPSVISAFQSLAEKRMKRMPLQYLIGEAPFYRRLFKVDRRVLIPRPETELLCDWALELLKNTSSPHILDLCCGSGCIGLTIKAERPDAFVTLSDISPDALDIASDNAVRLALDVSFRRSDLFSALTGCAFDLIISNPPYIPSEECGRLQAEVLSEPRLALDGGPDGCGLYRRIVSAAGSFLVPGGRLLMELGIRQSETVAALLADHGFTGIEIRKDYTGINRMILAVLN